MKNKQKTIAIIITFILILISGIISGQKAVLMIPLFISLFVMAFQAEANRFAYLIGGINCLVYTLVYLYLGLYATAASTLLFSFPLQILTFINWQRNSYKKSVKLKKMSVKLRVAAVLVFVAVWLPSFAVLSAAGSVYAFLDNTAAIVGIAVSILTMLAYIEYSYLWLISSVLGIMLNVQLTINSPGQITYLIYSLYSFYCVILAFINVRKIYREQAE